MARPLKYPELLDLKIGESLLIPRDEVGDIRVLRVVVSRLSKKHGLRLSVRDDYKENDIEISRWPNKTEQSARRIAPSQPDIKTRLDAEVERLRAEWAQEE